MFQRAYVGLASAPNDFDKYPTGRTLQGDSLPASSFSSHTVQQRSELAHCRGQGGDHIIAKVCTAQFVEGWDWMVPVPDRGTGIWDHVSITWTGPVLLQVLMLLVHDIDTTLGLLGKSQRRVDP